MKIKIVFVNEKLEKSFVKLKNSKTEDKRLREWLVRAFQDIEKDPTCGIQIPKKLIPREYIQKHGIDNLWKYDMPNAWRLIYSVQKGTVVLLAIILEWLDHKNYERRFRY